MPLGYEEQKPKIKLLSEHPEQDKIIANMNRGFLEALLKRSLSAKDVTLKEIEEQTAFVFFERCVTEFNRIYAEYKENFGMFCLIDCDKPSKKGIEEALEDLQSALADFLVKT